MAYVTTTTRASGYTVTAADWNIFANNFTALRKDYCIVKRSAVQSIPDNVLTAVLWDQEAYDPQTMHSTAVNTDRITVARTGLYLVSCQIKFTAHPSSDFDYCDLYLNLSSIVNEIRPGNALIDNTFNHFTIAYAAATDYFSVKVKQNTGGALNLMRDDDYTPRFAVAMLEDLT